MESVLPVKPACKIKEHIYEEIGKPSNDTADVAKLDAPGQNFANAVLNSVFNREQFKMLLEKQHDIEADDENIVEAHKSKAETMSDNIRDETDMSAFAQNVLISDNTSISNLNISSDPDNKFEHNQKQTESPFSSIHPVLEILKHDVDQSSLHEINDNSHGCTPRHVFISFYCILSINSQSN